MREIAVRAARHLAPGVDAEELVCAGMLGLLDAIDRHAAARGVPFRDYAEVRVRCAIVDGLQRAGWAPRALSSRIA
ncbi:MAG: sigma factor [Pseudomonadota bacterium]|nr:sigma factor [Pseudomonadota bacterium]